jgi:EAL domain-containing protein (putative c-di-GMP-specific phosphodiesterase class I)
MPVTAAPVHERRPGPAREPVNALHDEHGPETVAPRRRGRDAPAIGPAHPPRLQAPPQAADAERVSRRRTPVEEQVAELLRTARSSLRLSTAFLSRLDGRMQTLEVVESSVPFLFPEKIKVDQATSLCQAALDGEVPAVLPDLRDVPEAMRRPAAWVPRIRSFVTVPVRLSDGTLYGTLCAAGLSSDRELAERDRALMEVLARAAATVIEPTVAEESRRAEIEARLRPVVRAGGPQIALQPIVDLATRVPVGAEALSRFPPDWQRTPDVVFAEAHGVGLGESLELQAVRRALGTVAAVDGYVSINLSPQTLLTTRAGRLLRRAPLGRLVLELSEHDRVSDYDELNAAVAPLRTGGLRLAIDDVGAGFSSLRHIVVTSPDVIKLDRSLVAGVSTDGVLTTLARSLVDFASGVGASVVAEGIETEADAERLRRLGVGFGQGWLFGRPQPASPVPSPPDGRAVPRHPLGVPLPGPRRDLGAAVES